MNFTREPLVETIITPREGYKLVIRNSKGGQEDFFVDAIEVISFGNTSFFRSLEKPKCFLVPVNDYEVLEVRESRMVLKTTAVEKGGIKIAGGREAPLKAPKEEVVIQEVEATGIVEQRADKRRERRRYRKKRGKDEFEEDGVEAQEELPVQPVDQPKERRAEKPSLIPPPQTLISETITRYKALVESEGLSADEKMKQPLPPPQFPPRETEESQQTEDVEETDEEIPF